MSGLFTSGDQRIGAQTFPNACGQLTLGYLGWLVIGRKGLSVNLYALPLHLLFRLEAAFLNNFIEIFPCHIIHHLKCTDQQLLVSSNSCTSITVIHFRTFSLPPERSPTPLPPRLPIPPSPWKLPTYFLPLQISLFWTFRIQMESYTMWSFATAFFHLA